MERGLWRVLAFCLALHCCLVFNLWQLSAEEPGLKIEALDDDSGPGVRQYDATGTDMVDIVAPNKRGVSHNKFKKFNVGKAGVVLNNSTRSTRSSLLGMVGKNKKLGDTAATLILNEVIDGSQSELLGTTEIVGKEADYVLANPNGIVCDGCGFENASRVTLSTGSHFDTGNGDEWELRTTSNGMVEIKGAGLNAENVDYFEIISRQAKISGSASSSSGIKTKNLRMVLGANRFIYNDDKKILDKGSSIEANGSIDGPALDVTALGGVEADRITIRSTDSGVGVKVQGNMAATAGNIQLTADGKIQISKFREDTNTRLQARTGRVTLESTSDEIDLQAGSRVVATEDGVVLNAQKNIRLAETSKVRGAKFVQLNATGVGEENAITNAGDISGNLVFLNAGDENNDANLENSGAIRADQWLEVRTTGDIENTGQLDASLGYVYLDVRSGELSNKEGGSIEGMSGVSIRSGDFLNDSSHLFGGLSLAVSSQDIQGRTNGNIESTGGSLLSAGDLSLHTRDGSIDLSNTQIGAVGELYLVADAGGITLTDSTIVAGERAYLEAGSDLSITRGTIRSNNIHLESTNSSVTNTGAHIRAEQTELADLEALVGEELPDTTDAQAALDLIRELREATKLSIEVETFQCEAVVGTRDGVECNWVDSEVTEMRVREELKKFMAWSILSENLTDEQVLDALRASFPADDDNPAANTLTIKAGTNLVNQGGGKLIADTLVFDINEGEGNFQNLGAESEIKSLGADLSIDALDITNSGLISAEGDGKLILSGNSYNSAEGVVGGKLHSAGDMELNFGTGAVFNRAGSEILSTGGKVRISAGTLTNEANATIRSEETSDEECSPDGTAYGNCGISILLSGASSESDPTLSNQGDIHSASSLMIVSGEGKIENSATIASMGDLKIYGRALEASGSNARAWSVNWGEKGTIDLHNAAGASIITTMSSYINIDLAGGTLTNSGSLTNAGEVVGDRSIDVIPNEEIQQADGPFGTIGIIAGNLENTSGGKIISAGYARLIVAENLKNDNSEIGSIRGVTALQSNTLDNLNGAKIFGAEVSLHVETIRNGYADDEGNIIEAGGTIDGGSLLKIRGGSLENAGTLTAAQVEVNVRGSITNRSDGVIHAKEAGDGITSLKLKGSTLTNENLIASAGSAELDFHVHEVSQEGNFRKSIYTGGINNSGRIYSAANATIKTHNLINEEGGSIRAGVDAQGIAVDPSLNYLRGLSDVKLEISSSGSIENKEGASIKSTNILEMSILNLENAGTIAGHQVGIVAVGLNESISDPDSTIINNGTIRTNGGRLEIVAFSLLNNDNALIASGGEAELFAYDYITNSGNIYSAGSTMIMGERLTNSGSIKTGVDAVGEAISNPSSAHLLLGFRDDINNGNEATISSAGHLLIRGDIDDPIRTDLPIKGFLSGDCFHTLCTNEKILQELQEDLVSASSARVLENSGTISAGRVASIYVEGLTNSGTIETSDDELIVYAKNIENEEGGRIQATGDGAVFLRSISDVINSGTISANSGGLVMFGRTLENSGLISTTDSSAGLMYQYIGNEDTSVSAEDGSLRGIRIVGELELIAATLHNAGGFIEGGSNSLIGIKSVLQNQDVNGGNKGTLKGGILMYEGYLGAGDDRILLTNDEKEYGVDLNGGGGLLGDLLTVGDLKKAFSESSEEWRNGIDIAALLREYENHVSAREILAMARETEEVEEEDSLSSDERKFIFNLSLYILSGSRDGSLSDEEIDDLEDDLSDPDYIGIIYSHPGFNLDSLSRNDMAAFLENPRESKRRRGIEKQDLPPTSDKEQKDTDDGSDDGGPSTVGRANPAGVFIPVVVAAAPAAVAVARGFFASPAARAAASNLAARASSFGPIIHRGGNWLLQNLTSPQTHNMYGMSVSATGSPIPGALLWHTGSQAWEDVTANDDQPNTDIGTSSYQGTPVITPSDSTGTTTTIVSDSSYGMPREVYYVIVGYRQATERNMKRVCDYFNQNSYPHYTEGNYRNYRYENYEIRCWGNNGNGVIF